jgi:hypothetical protein
LLSDSEITKLCDAGRVKEYPSDEFLVIALRLAQ